MKKRIFLFLLVLLFLAGAYFYFQKEKAKKTENETPHASLKKETIETKIAVSGTIIPSSEINITAHLSGIISKLFHQVGDEVGKGTPLVQIEIISNPLDYSNMLKSLEAAQLTQKETQQIYERNKTLFENKAVAVADLQQSENRLKTAEVEVNRIKKQLDILTGKESDNLVRASVSGIISELPVKMGGSVMGRGSFSEGTVVAKIANMKRFYFKGMLTDREIIHLRKGDKFKVKLAALPTQYFEAVVQIISPKSTDEKEGNAARFEVLALLHIPDNQVNMIRSGFNAIAEKVIEHKENIWAMEESLVQFSNDSAYVEVKNDTGYVKKYLKLGISNGLKIEILEGITEKDKIKIKKKSE